MATHVYANDLEIACKSTDGVATTAFPDPCWSPPSPPAGPIVIPYPNTAFARHITNGTRTVFIKRKEVAVEDKAYFSTSTGDEPATNAFPKGVATQALRGKAYFRSWSMDVQFEGLGVDRHTDMVSHNHGSFPSNTPLFPYVSRSWMKKFECKDEEKRIERACGKEKDKSETKQSLLGKSKLRQRLKSLPARKREGQSKSGWHWTDDHCDGLHVALGSKEDALNYVKELEETFKKLPEEIIILNEIKSELTDMAVNAVMKTGGKWVARSGAKQIGGSAVPGWGNAAMGVISLIDGVLSIGDISEMRTAAKEALAQLDVLTSRANDLQSLAKHFDGFSSLTPEEQLAKARELGATGQDVLATLNECLRARKCNLVPYEADGMIKQRSGSKVESSNKGGCCKGQTGHHLIPGASIADSCPNYDHDVAPVVCAEGTSWDVGSHGRAHEAYAYAIGKVPADANNTVSLDNAISAAVASHTAAFPLSKCSPKCIRAQLEGYYKQMCPNARPSVVNAQGKLPSDHTGNAK